MNPRTVLNFVDSRGNDVIYEWLHQKRMPVGVRAHLDALIEIVRVMDRLVPPQVRYLDERDGCKGLIELRFKYRTTPYRPIGWASPDESLIILLAGAVEKDRRFEPQNVCTIAWRHLHLYQEEGGHGHAYTSG